MTAKMRALVVGAVTVTLAGVAVVVSNPGIASHRSHR